MERIDRIEKAIEELVASQKKTDAQLAKTDAQLAKTDAQLAKTDEHYPACLSLVTFPVHRTMLIQGF